MHSSEEKVNWRANMEKTRHCPQAKTTSFETRLVSRSRHKCGRIDRYACRASFNKQVYLVLSIILFIYLHQIASVATKKQVTSKPEVRRSSRSKDNKIEQHVIHQLDCQAGEQRYFNYESATKVWGSESQQVHLRASLRLRCMEPASDNTLKYMAEILSLTPSFGDKNTRDQKKLNPKRESKQQQVAALFDARAEPVFEEVGEVLSETATRVKRSVSGWLSKTWGSVKDFFGNIFTSSDKSTVSRDQAFKDTGIDIANQCRSPKGKGNGLPIDDSVFEDLEPKYYIGASVDSLAGTGYEFEDDNKRDQDEDELISFFDEPKTAERVKRATGGKRTSAKADEYEKQLKLPFVFIQSRSGRILELRLSSEDQDLSVRNFKRHLCDLFATNLDKNKSQLSEVTPIGQHTTKYLVDSSTNSSAIKQTLMKPNVVDNKAEQLSNKQLVRVLALVGMQTASNSGEQSFEADGSVDSREPNLNGSSQGSDSLSVLRTINSTNSIQLNSRTIAPDIDSMEVRVKQVQQISEGRMTASAGQLGMSLVQSQTASRSSSAPRNRRSVGADEPQVVGDMAELLQVSTSFSVQLVPMSKLGNFADMLLVANHDVSSKPTGGDTSARLRRSPAASVPSTENSTLRDEGKQGEKKSQRRAIKREPLVSRPTDLQEQQRVLLEWRHLESQLQFSSSNLMAESSRSDGQMQRLELLRDQIQMRLNEEFMRNRLRRTAARQVVAASTMAGQSLDGARKAATKHNDLGLSLTQLILENGITSKRKGSVYSVIEEVIELEFALDEEAQDGAISKLLRDTIQIGRLRAHCKASIASLDQIRAQSARIELKQPFNVMINTSSDDEKISRVVSNVEVKNRHKLNQCTQVLQLLLRVSDRQAINLGIELMDECNYRMLEGSKHEELGHGPTSKYYRNLRQQFTELMANINKPTELVLDRLMQRLHYTRKPDSPKRKSNPDSQHEFVYVSAKESPLDTRYDKSLLQEEDDFNNNDGAGSLVMTITTLASKPSIGVNKRIEVINKLLMTLKGSSCSPFNGPDLDILESMSNFHEPMDDIVGKVVHLARQCKHKDQYLVASIHALQGQLQHSVAQRFLLELLRSNNSSCTLKSEIVLTLVGAIMIRDLQVDGQPSRSAQSNEINLSPPTTSGWPRSGFNQIDDALIELVDVKSNRQQDRKCLGQLVTYYLSKKEQLSNDLGKQVTESSAKRERNGKARHRRDSGEPEGADKNSFWDEAQCKRWALPIEGAPSNSTGNEITDEIDDNSILVALANSRQANTLSGSSSRNNRHNLRLVERETDSVISKQASELASTVRRRHKCSASKTFGPRNAQTTLRAEVVNDLVGPKDENKFLARFRLAANFLGNKMDIGRMYLWHQKHITRAHVNILGKSLWDTSHSCQDKTPHHLLYMPLFDFNLWLVKVSVGLRLQSEMGFFSNCNQAALNQTDRSDDQLELYPTISLRASSEASAKFVVARAGMSLASQYGYQGNIRVSRQPESCMSIFSAHQPMNVTFSSWFQLWDGDCHFWGSRNKAQPQATKWRLMARKPTAWLQDECLNSSGDSNTNSSLLAGSPQGRISP